MTIAAADLGRIAAGAKLAGLLPYLEAEVDRMDRALENRVYDLINKGALTPEAAFMAWLEKKTLRAFVTRLRQKVNMGQSVGERHVEDLSIDPKAPNYYEELPLPTAG